MRCPVAAILDSRGILVRVIIAPRSALHHHIGQGESLFVIPNIEAEDPPPWDAIAGIVERVKKALDEG